MTNWGVSAEEIRAEMEADGYIVHSVTPRKGGGYVVSCRLSEEARLRRIAEANTKGGEAE